MSYRDPVEALRERERKASHWLKAVLLIAVFPSVLYSAFSVFDVGSFSFEPTPPEDEEDEEEVEDLSAGERHCLAPSNVGAIGEKGPCEGMLIVNEEMLNEAVDEAHKPFEVMPVHNDPWGSLPEVRVSDLRELSDLADEENPNRYAIKHEASGEFYSFTDSERNIYTGQVEDMGSLFSMDIEKGRLTKEGRTIPWIVNSDGEAMFEVKKEVAGTIETDKVLLVKDNGEEHFPIRAFSDFDGDIRYWDTRNLENVRLMFYGAVFFDNDLSGWDTSSLTSSNDLVGK